MLRAPLFFTSAFLVGLFAQISPPHSTTEQAIIYSIVGTGVVAGFSAVWVKLWKMHEEWRDDKNATIAELKKVVAENTVRILELERDLLRAETEDNHHA